MNEDKKYSTDMGYCFPRVRLMADPDFATIPGYKEGEKREIMRVKFYKETKSKRNVDYPVEITVDVGRTPWLRKVKKGDYVGTSDARNGLDLRLYPSKAKSAFQGVGAVLEGRFPQVFVVHADLRARPDVAAPAAEGSESSGGGSFFEEG